MQTRTYLQRRSHSESSDRLVVNLQPRPWGEPHQQQAAQPQPIRHDFSHVDLFAHDPGPRTINFGIQPKLTVGAPNDVYEQEADRVAEQVMAMPDTQPSVQRERLPEEEEALQTKALGHSIQREALPEEEEDLQMKPLAATITPLVQREALPEEDEELQTKPLSSSIQREALPEEEELQTKPLGHSIQREALPEEDEELQTKSLGDSIQREALPEEEELQTKPLGNSIQREALPEEEEELQMKRSPDAGFQAGNNLESRLNSSQGGGSPLPDEVRTFMELRFGADFSQVRVHTGNEAVQMNQDLSAQAFTHKQDVYFGAGKAPAMDALTAHELTHVVQQSGNGNFKPLFQQNSTAIDFISKQGKPSAGNQNPPMDECSAAINDANWSKAAFLLNGLNADAILAKFKKHQLQRRELKQLHQAAIQQAGVGPGSQIALRTNPVVGLDQNAVAEVEAKILTGQFPAAIDQMVGLLASAGKIDISKIKNKRMLFNDQNSGTDHAFTVAQKDTDGKPSPSLINIRPSVFTGKDVSVLYAVIIHEYQHALQFISDGKAVIKGQDTSGDQREVEAHAQGILTSKQSGIFDLPELMEEVWRLLVKSWRSLAAENRKPLQSLFDQAKVIAAQAIPKLIFESIPNN